MNLSINPQGKVQGNIIKWKEGNIIGKGSYGEVIKAMNIKDGSLFAVKKLSIFSGIGGVN
jgi:uncharacterized membrane protein